MGGIPAGLNGFGLVGITGVIAPKGGLPGLLTDDNAEESPLQPQSPLQPVEEKSYFQSPNSPASNLIMEVLGAGENVADLPGRKRQTNRKAELKVLESGNKRQIRLKEPLADITLDLEDINKLLGSKKPGKKLFKFALIKANEQSIHNGQLSQDYISFPLQELVSMGFYKSIESARKGFKAGADTLISMKLKGKIRKSKKSESVIERAEVPFTGYGIENNQCFIRLNYALKWDLLIQYYTLLPKYYFRLPNRASDLLEYISYLARQRTRDIEKQGYFTIGFRAIQHRLNLPREIGNDNPYRTIQQPIEEAIEQIEKEQAKLGNMDLSLFPVYDEDGSIKSFLDNGFLKVTLTGEYKAFFLNISQKNAKRIETAQKQKDRILEKAKAINMAKKMEEEAATDLSDA